MRGGAGSWGALSRRGAGRCGARGQRSRAGARGCSRNASRPHRLGARRLMSPPPRLSGRAHRRLPPLAAAGAFSKRGRRGGGGPGAGPGPSRHNEDAGPGGSPLGARPDGRSARLGAPRPHQRRPSLLACLQRPLYCLRLLLATLGWREALRLSATGPAAPKGQSPRGWGWWALEAVGALRPGAMTRAAAQMLPELGRLRCPRTQLGAGRPHSPIFAASTHLHPLAQEWGARRGRVRPSPRGGTA